MKSLKETIENSQTLTGLCEAVSRGKHGMDDTGKLRTGTTYVDAVQILSNDKVFQWIDSVNYVDALRNHTALPKTVDFSEWWMNSDDTEPTKIWIFPDRKKYIELTFDESDSLETAEEYLLSGRKVTGRGSDTSDILEILNGLLER